MEKKAGNRGRGRPKGSPNKTQAAVKDMILTALSELGGVEYLKKRGKDSPAAFLTLIGKVLPLQVTGENGAPFVPQINVVITHAALSNKS